MTPRSRRLIRAVGMKVPSKSGGSVRFSRPLSGRSTDYEGPFSISTTRWRTRSVSGSLRITYLVALARWSTRSFCVRATSTRFCWMLFTQRSLEILIAGFVHGDARIALWAVALAIDYLGPAVVGIGRGWRVAPERFAERHGLIVLTPRLVEHRPRRRCRLPAHHRGDPRRSARHRRCLGALVALFRRRRHLRAQTADARRWPRAGASRARRLQLPPLTDDRRHRPLRPRPQDDTPSRRHCARHRSRRRTLRRRRTLPARAHRVPLANDRPSLPSADDRRGSAARPHPRRGRDPCPCRACACRRRLLARRGVRSNPLPRAARPRQTSRACELIAAAAGRRCPARTFVLRLRRTRPIRILRES